MVFEEKARKGKMNCKRERERCRGEMSNCSDAGGRDM
jgi:hypothetical protein